MSYSVVRPNIQLLSVGTNTDYPMMISALDIYLEWGVARPGMPEYTCCIDRTNI